jgi:Zn-dependent protease
MNNAHAHLTDESPREIGSVFNTPLVISGFSWLPVTQIIVWPVMTWLANRYLPDMSIWRSIRQGALLTTIMLGSEWCHNLAHAFAARAIGKPMDQIRIMLGMPRCVYHDLNDPNVKPNEHVIRSLGGPLINALFLPFTWFVRQLTTEGTPARQVANLAVGTNLFLSTVSLLPIPFIDGGPILKWSLVERGQSVEEAEKTVRRVNGPLALAAVLLAGLAFRRRKTLIGVILGMFSLSSLGIFLGWIQEEKIPW